MAKKVKSFNVDEVAYGSMVAAKRLRDRGKYFVFVRQVSKGTVELLQDYGEGVGRLPGTQGNYAIRYRPEGSTEFDLYAREGVTRGG